MVKESSRRPRRERENTEIMEVAIETIIDTHETTEPDCKLEIISSKKESMREKMGMGKYENPGIEASQTLETLDDIIDVISTGDNVNENDDISYDGPLDAEPTILKKKKSCSIASCIFLTICITSILIGCSIGAAFAFLGTPNPLKFLDFSDHEGANVKDQWETKGAGLELVIENALDDYWTPYLEEYVNEWDNGNPDSLSLTISRVKVDSVCEPSNGKLKVCNGDYGETSWEGLNLSLVQEGFIRWSTSRVNDFFLLSESEATRSYTMCHELGHGFGLSHSDEEYYNMNRGDCMDYTHRPLGNLKPGGVNHEALEEVYGSIPYSRRRLRRKLEEDIPRHIIERYFEIEERVQNSYEDDGGEWVEELGEGYHMNIAKLLHVPR